MAIRINKPVRLGVMFRREQNPEGLPWFARQAEAAGFDELWVVEDCFYASGVAAAATALACTEKITVGLGIMPAVVRNPAFAAMEIATLCRLHPGRFLPGIGHGVAGWMRQVGALQAEMPDAWIDQLTITGSPDEWRAAIDRFADLGAASVVLVPRPNAGLDEVKVFARHLSEG